MKEVIDLLEDLDLRKKLSDEEMVRVIRFMLAFENEAFQLYMHLMTNTDNLKVSTLFKDIADEKRFQVTHLIKLLKDLKAEKKYRLH